MGPTEAETADESKGALDVAVPDADGSNWSFSCLPVFSSTLSPQIMHRLPSPEQLGHKVNGLYVVMKSLWQPAHGFEEGSSCFCRLCDALWFSQKQAVFVDRAIELGGAVAVAAAAAAG
jgi:hypothetical protein